MLTCLRPQRQHIHFRAMPVSERAGGPCHRRVRCASTTLLAKLNLGDFVPTRGSLDRPRQLLSALPWTHGLFQAGSEPACCEHHDAR